MCAMHTLLVIKTSDFIIKIEGNSNSDTSLRSGVQFSIVDRISVIAIHLADSVAATRLTPKGDHAGSPLHAHADLSVPRK